ncbi:hypothetical protein [Rhodococcus chondri]|uniref:Uncharacterized protein n=1 Tax=Rhodococcus chondri TaxID=3065941 RepID=A0ABU7JL95_9NOCA|nr:hypothetical protein [Rhodococcus sp. CC-R104]MEE2030810.1 hypothetical protein [Rhodococcus sp. CC-R104]
MCYPVDCPRCGKTGWGGCGNHVDAVMAAVPANRRCTCDTTATEKSDKGGFIRSLFGR